MCSSGSMTCRSAIVVHSNLGIEYPQHPSATSGSWSFILDPKTLKPWSKMNPPETFSKKSPYHSKPLRGLELLGLGWNCAGHIWDYQDTTYKQIWNWKRMRFSKMIFKFGPSQRIQFVVGLKFGYSWPLWLVTRFCNQHVQFSTLRVRSDTIMCFHFGSAMHWLSTNSSYRGLIWFSCGLSLLGVY